MNTPIEYTFKSDGIIGLTLPSIASIGDTITVHCNDSIGITIYQAPQTYIELKEEFIPARWVTVNKESCNE